MMNRNKYERAIYLKSDGMCVYCGGDTPAVNIDHMPPKIMFDGKDRPQGLEYASCKACNNDAGKTDTVCSLIGRIYPDNDDPIALSDLQKLLKGSQNNDPKFFQEIISNIDSPRFDNRNINTPEETHTFNIGPLARSHLEAFGARLGLAMHFEATGKILDKNGAVFVRIYTNYDMLNSPPPESLFKVLAPRTLEQGRKNASNQFRYDFGALPDGSASLCFATFRQSYGLLTVAIAPERSDLSASFQRNAKAFRPGAFNLNQDPP